MLANFSATVWGLPLAGEVLVDATDQFHSAKSLSLHHHEVVRGGAFLDCWLASTRHSRQPLLPGSTSGSDTQDSAMRSRYRAALSAIAGSNSHCPRYLLQR